MDVLLELLAWLLEPLLEALVEYVAAAVLDLLLRSLKEVFADARMRSPLAAFVGYMLFGAIFGVVSLALFPHPLVHPSRFHGISLLIGPTITGLMMSATGAVLRSYHKPASQLESFGYGFAFAFGMALMRVVFAR
ncbi:MAG: hypothetical protein LAO20_05740 [Acidobacteriia bacterium]|nr:hypothetical protein [Terriglobia bacterium]